MRKINHSSTKRHYRSLYLILILTFTWVSGFSQSIGINATGADPNAASGLDVDFPNKGMLIPRVALTGSSNFAPLAAHVAGMLIYNTATAGDVTPGFYYDNGSKWMPAFPAGNAVGSMIYWNGTSWLPIPAGLPGQYLSLDAGGIPIWGGAAYATITTNAVTAITGISATSGGNIPTDGGSPVIARGICWSTTPNPILINSKTTDGSGIGAFVSSMTGLTPVTTYYVRAYSTNSYTTAYGNQVSFTTLPVLATLTTTGASSITTTTANSGGNITNNGGATITERGICYATTANPTTANTKIIDPAPGTGSFISNITGLTSYTTYYVRAYAINSAGTSYGVQISFQTLPVPLTLNTVAATSIAGSSAVSGGSMNGSFVGYSNYQNYGIAYSTVPNSATPTFFATNTSNFPTSTPLLPWVTNLTGLTANTTYYIRAYLNLYRISPSGWITIFGNELTFTTTAPTAPVVASTTAITAINGNSATSGGNVTSDGGSPVTVRGVCWSTSPAPTLGVSNFTTNGAGTGTYSSSITGLTGSTTYYVRAYATNGVGTSYAPVDVSFTTWVSAPYNVGQDVGGYGICVYTDATGKGFIVSYDIPSTNPWGCSGTSIATSVALGSGAANTDLILANCPTRPIAASIAKTYNGGGYLDWYLPSSGDWTQIAIGASSNLYYHSTNNFYTSSQSSATYASTYFFNYNSGYSSGAAKANGVNDYVFYLRAARSFTTADPTTAAASNITNNSATIGGNIISNGGPAIVARGVCWSTTAAPTLSDPHTTDGAGAGAFVSNLSGLSPNTTYHVRAYSTISSTSYGNDVTFTTLP